ncbi:MAG: type IX secretion system membrane protein PorP/SprF [Bacteroidia bacterium]
MKTLKKIIPVLVLALGNITVRAQQAPLFTHYMYNTLAINPAYAGSREALTVTALARDQWVGFSGAPTTQTLTIHAPLQNEHLGIGLSVLNDKIGPINNTSFAVDFAYIMKMNAVSKLALGISAGADMFQANLNTLNLDQQNDVVFQNNINSHVTPNFGFGAYYYRESFYAGISVPDLLQNNYSVINQPDGSTLVGNEQRTYFLITGAMLKVSDNLGFKPTAFLKVTAGAPAQADLTASFVIMKKLLLGAMFRTGDSFGALVGVNITEQFHIGYSYDWSFGLATSRYNQGSNEIVLRYDFIFPSDKQIHSPRYF